MARTTQYDPDRAPEDTTPPAPLPSLLYRGTIKTHGTHGDIAFDETLNIQVQSRNHILTEQSTNMGFWNFVVGIPADDIKAFFRKIEQVCIGMPDFSHPIVISGEWCGRGIQKGVGISELDRFFIFYNIHYGPDDARTWVDIARFTGVNLEAHRIFNILDFDHYEKMIDFERPDAILNDLIHLTDEVEAACPVAVKIAAMDGRTLQIKTGEGLVWVCLNPAFASSQYWFKTKGDEHRGSKHAIGIEPEKAASIDQFIKQTVTEPRLQQALTEMSLDITDKKFIGAFISWVYKDILKEEYDTLKASGLTGKDISNHVAKTATRWIRAQRANI